MGGEWAWCQKAGWVHCVTTHPPFLQVYACVIIFLAAEDSESGNMSFLNAFRKYRLLDCSSALEPLPLCSSEMQRWLCGSHKRKGEKKEQYSNNAVDMRARLKRSCGFIGCLWIGAIKKHRLNHWNVLLCRKPDEWLVLNERRISDKSIKHVCISL